MDKTTLSLAALLILSGCICVPSGNLTNPFTSTTSTTASTLASTTTLIETTTTLESTTSTSTTTTTPPPKKTTTTTDSTTTTTTLKGSCSTTADCGGPSTHLGCNNNKVMRFEEKPSCQHSPDGSKCVSSVRATVVESCQTGEYCVNATCKRKTEDDNSVHNVTTTTATTIRITFLTTTTTIMAVPDAKFCWARTYARNQRDCDSLICRGQLSTCKYVGEGESGHCTCG